MMIFNIRYSYFKWLIQNKNNKRKDKEKLKDKM